MENRESLPEHNLSVIEAQTGNYELINENPHNLNEEINSLDVLHEKNILIEKKILDGEKIAEIREKLGLSESEPLSMLEGIDANCFDNEQLEIVKKFYLNRKMRTNIINPDLHLRNYDRIITKIGSKTDRLLGKPEFIKKIQSEGELNFENMDDFSIGYLDVEHETKPIIDNIERSIREILNTLTPEQNELKIKVEKQDVHSFVKKIFVDKVNVLTENVPFEENTLWQALKKAKFEITLNRNPEEVTYDGGGGGETVGVWAKVNGSLDNVGEAIETFESLVTHEYTHVNQTAVSPKMYAGSDFAGRTFAGHSTHPTETQARINESIFYARKNNISFSSALSIVVDKYINKSTDRIYKEISDTNTFKNDMISLHSEFFDKNYSDIKSLYNL